MALEPFYRTIDHTADIAIEVLASTQGDIFIRSSLAMFDLMFGVDSIGRDLRRPVAVTAESVEELLVAWLNELLYVYAVEHVIFSGFADVKLEEGVFSATGLGERFDPRKHDVAADIKAATYHNLSVVRDGAGWKATVIFDV